MASSLSESEEGLTLFQHLQAREDRKFLDNCEDDIEEIKYDDGLSTFRISASTPTRGGGLLVFDAEKNDYDWLLTPPRTPLFPSLDQKTAILDVKQGPRFMGPASASKASKELLLKSPSELGRRGGSVARTTVHANPSPRRGKAASPSRISTSSSLARSPSPSPSSTGSQQSMGAFSPRRSVTTTGLSPARASKLRSKSLASLVCQDNMSPLIAGGHGYSIRRGPRRSLSPSSRPWEPAKAACPTELPPNLRTSPSNNSIQRGNVDGTGKGASFRIGGSSLETLLNFQRSKWRAMYAENIESYRFSSKPKQLSKVSPDAQSENVARRNPNKGLSIATISLSEDQHNGSHVRRRALASTWNKEVISDFANEKLLERQMATGGSLHNMFQPLTSSAPATLCHKTKPGSLNNELSSRAISPSRPGNGSSKWDLKASPEIDCSRRFVEHGKLSQRYNSVATGPITAKDGLRKLDVPCRTRNYNCTCEEIPASKLGKEIGAACPWIQNQMFVSEQVKVGQAGRESPTPHVKPDSTVDMKDLNPAVQNENLRYTKHTLLEKIPIGNTQMLAVRSNRPEKLIQHGREEHRVLSNSLHMFAGNNFKQKLMESQGESLSPQVSLNNSLVSQCGARLPVRRQLPMGNADMVHSTWSTKKTEGFDISTSDSYSCSESLDSSFLDNCTERFSEDLSEVETMSHTGFSNSNSSAILHSFHNLISLGKGSSEMQTGIGTEQDRVLYSMPRNCGSASLEATNFLRKTGEKKQGMQVPTELMDSPHFLDRGYGSHRLSLGSVPSFIQALYLKQSPSSAQQLYTDLHVGGERPATVLNMHIGDREGGRCHAVKTTSVITKESQDTDGDADESCKPQTSPLTRNVTLEEATETILFCSSILHQVVYDAAALGEERSKMKSDQDPTIGCGLTWNTDSGRSSPCWSWNRRKQPLPNIVVHKDNDVEPQPAVEAMPSIKCGRSGLISPRRAGEVELKGRKKGGFCCFSS
ncbi:hypothetical protein L7F22_004126 [Adiantum nelumboides]|nr:hypothetical protein [Adiantum nelumboides]